MQPVDSCLIWQSVGVRHHGQPGDKVVGLHSVGVVFANVAEQFLTGTIEQHKCGVMDGLTMKLVAIRNAKFFCQPGVRVAINDR